MVSVISSSIFVDLAKPIEPPDDDYIACIYDL